MTSLAFAQDLPSLTDNGKARSASLNSLAIDLATTSVVPYSSAGRLLIIGSKSVVSQAYAEFPESNIQPHLLVIDDEMESNSSVVQDVTLTDAFAADSCSVTGYFGAFSVSVYKSGRELDLAKTAGIESGLFDLVLDLSRSPLIPTEVPPPGYYWIQPEERNEQRFRETAIEVSDMIGNFEKPKYFNYDPEICAHSRSGIVACTRCIDACPTDAILSFNEQVEVNPYLCQGGGSCATACPTGAITYAYPTPANQLEILRQVILNYRDAGGGNAVILFFDQANGSEVVQNCISSLDENVLPIQVEEVGSIGLDAYLSLLAYGAHSAKILCTKTPDSVRRELTEQIAILDALLNGLGYESGAVELLEVDELTSSNENFGTRMEIASAKFMPSGLKRTDMRIALEHLHELSPLKPESVELPKHAPFGEIKVNLNTCTLCMGCVSVCPASALEAGGDVPKLSFIENNCVQCGLCESACPENSISRVSQYVFDTDKRMRSSTLNEDSPFNCRMCGKPFATNVMMNRMKDKLKNHWMFKDPEAIARLELCEDCRVKDMFAAEGGFPRDKL